MECTQPVTVTRAFWNLKQKIKYQESYLFANKFQNGTSCLRIYILHFIMIYCVA